MISHYIFNIIVILFIIGWIWVFIIDKFFPSKKSLSIPPSPPIVTPTIMIKDIAIGDATYYETVHPEHIISVISVTDEYVYIMEANGDTKYVLYDNFMLTYDRRTQTRISKL